MLLKWRASLTCFRTCFLPGRAKGLSAPPIINCTHLVQNKKSYWKIRRFARSAVGILLSQTRSLLTAKQVWDATLKKRYERESHTLPQSIERFLSCQKIVCFSLTLASKSPRGYEFWKSLTFPKGSPFHPMKGMWPWHQARIPQEYPTATTRKNIHEICNYLKDRVYQEINTRTLKYTRG